MLGGMMLFWALLLIVIVVALFRLLPGSSFRPGLEDRRGTPLKQLQHRYARGEISTEEYERDRSRLRAP